MTKSTEGEESKVTRNGIHKHEAMIIFEGAPKVLANKEAAEKFISEHIEAGQSIKVYLLYKTYSMKQVVTNKLEAK